MNIAGPRGTPDPTGEGPTVMFASHRNWVDRFAVPGDFDSATEIEHGMDFRLWRPGYGVMVHLAGIFVFTPDGGITHHGVGELATDEEAARHSVEVLKHAGDALFTDAATICARLRRPHGVEFTTSRLDSRPGWIKPQSSQQKRSRARRHEGVRKGARPRLSENRISEPILRLLGPV